MSLRKSCTIAGLCASALVLIAACKSTKDAVDEEVATAATTTYTEVESTVADLETDANANLNKVVEEVKDEALGKLFPSPTLAGDVVLNVTLPENTTAVNLYRKAEDENDYQLVYQAWAENTSAKDSKGKKIEIIDYFVETGKKYDYKCNFRTLNDPNKTDYDQTNIGGFDSNEITIMPVKGYGDFKLTNTPAATYDQQTSRMTFTTLPTTNMSSIRVPDGLTKQPVKFVYVNPDLYSLWIYAPEDGEVPVFITLGKIAGIDTPTEAKAVMLDTTLKSDDGDGGWRLSIDKTSKTTVDGWSYEEHWYRKYTGSAYGLPATIVIPKSTVQKDTSTPQPVIDAK